MSIFGASPNTPSSPSQPSDTPGVAEHRLFIEQGRAMPGAFIAQSKRGITGLFGGQESKEVETFWAIGSVWQRYIVIHQHETSSGSHKC